MNLQFHERDAACVLCGTCFQYQFQPWFKLKWSLQLKLQIEFTRFLKFFNKWFVDFEFLTNKSPWDSLNAPLSIVPSKRELHSTLSHWFLHTPIQVHRNTTYSLVNMAHPSFRPLGRILSPLQYSTPLIQLYYWSHYYPSWWNFLSQTWVQALVWASLLLAACLQLLNYQGFQHAYMLDPLPLATPIPLETLQRKPHYQNIC